MALDLAIMIEGQDGLNWPRWQRLAQAAEDLGYAGLYRSDHFTNGDGPHKDALDLWTSLTYLAGHTKRIEFGPNVSPISFRNPVVTAWTAAAVDDLSGGRLRLGLGAGWQEREHRSFGFDLLDLNPRFARYAEGIEVIHRLLHADEPTSFSGEYYHLEDALLLPRPQRPGGPPITIGGSGERRTLPLVARFADEWNAVSITVERFVELNAKLDELIRREGRQPGDVRRTYMTRVIFGQDDAEVKRIAGDRADVLKERGALVGTASEIVEGLGKIADAGAVRVMAQWIELDDIDRIEAMAAAVLPQLGG